MERLEAIKKAKKERKEKVTITIEETGERFKVEKRRIIPIIEAVRIIDELEKRDVRGYEDIRSVSNILKMFTRIT